MLCVKQERVILLEAEQLLPIPLEHIRDLHFSDWWSRSSRILHANR